MTKVPRARPMALVGALALALLGSGCIQGADSGLPAKCGVRIPQDTVPGSAPHVGGPGPQAVKVKILDPSNSSLARVPVLAWWQAEDGSVDFVALRTDGSGLATVLAPTGAVVFLASGDGSWTHDARVARDGSVRGLVRGNGTGVIELLPALADGFAAGFWTQLVPTGLPVGAVAPVNWEPSAMPWGDAEHLARLEGLDLRLAWTNNLNGYVDLAVGVGTPESWQVWNQEIQTGSGTFVELHHLTRQDLAPWSDGGLHVGPAGGAYGVVVDQLRGVTYDLRWTATFTIDPTLGDLCARFGDVRLKDVTDGSR